MPDLMSAMSTAISLAGRLREISKNVGDAEFKNILADLSLELADAKLAMADIQVKGIDKDKEIEALKEKLKNKVKTVGFQGARYYANNDGEPTGSPFCPTCYAKDHELYPLTSWSRKEYTNKCGVCKNTIEQRLSPLDVDYYINSQREASVKLGREYEIKLLP
jgi:hypothetical protein